MIWLWLFLAAWVGYGAGCAVGWCYRGRYIPAPGVRFEFTDREPSDKQICCSCRLNYKFRRQMEFRGPSTLHCYAELDPKETPDG